jgi:hypothetical protein
VGDLPANLAAALSAAEATLQARDGVHSVLRVSHDDIPRLLRERESLHAEIARDEVVAGGAGGQLKASLSECDARLEEWRRRRRGAASVLLTDEKCGLAALLRARDSVSQAQREYTLSVVTMFRAKYDAAVEALRQLWCDADELAAALRTTIDTPVPARVSDHPVHSGQIERVPGASTVPAALPAGVVRVREVLDRLDQALAVCSGISRTHELSGILGKRQSIGLSESAMVSTDGVFMVTSETIRCGLDGLEWSHGVLVDQDLVGGPGVMQRLVVGRNVRRVDPGFAVVTTAA